MKIEKQNVVTLEQGNVLVVKTGTFEVHFHDEEVVVKETLGVEIVLVLDRGIGIYPKVGDLFADLEENIGIGVSTSVPLNEHSPSTVGGLVTHLLQHQGSMNVHLDATASDEEWEGDRVVRGVHNIRPQTGFHAVAIESYVACSF